MVEIIPKEEKRKISLERIFLIVSFLILVGILLTSLYFLFKEKSYQKEIKKIEEKIAEKEKEIKENEEAVLKLQKKISLFSQLLKERISPLLFFQELEKKIHPKIYLTKINLNLEKGEVSLLGKSPDFISVQQQLDILNEEKNWKTNLGKISFSKEGKVDFEILITFKKETLKQ